MKKRMKHHVYTLQSKYFFLVLFIVLAALSLFVLTPLANAIISAVLAAYITYPLYEWFTKKTKSSNIGALFVCGLLVLLFVLPLGFIVNRLSVESNYLYLRSKQMIVTGFACEPENTGALCSLTRWSEDPDVQVYLATIVKKAFSVITERLSQSILSLPKMIVSGIITLFVTFYLLQNGSALLQRLKRILPLEAKHQQAFFQQFADMTHAVLFGSVIIAFLQGLTALIGYILFGVGSPLTWALVTMIAAFLPIIGTWVVWLPAGLFMILTGSAIQNTLLVWKGVGLLAYGLIFISSLDGFLRPVLIGERSRIHPVIVFVGVFGGILAFGMIGFVIGPLILSLFSTIFSIYEQEKTNHPNP